MQYSYPVLLYLYIIIGVALFIIFFWIFVYYDIFSSEKGEKRNRMDPDVAVIIPTIFEGGFLKTCVDSALKIKYPQDKYKIYVVLNKSADAATIAAARSFRDKRVKIIDAPFDGKARVMNYTIQNFVKEEFILTMDADTIFDKAILVELLSHADDKNVGAVTPAVKALNVGNWIEFFQEYDYLLSVALRKAFSYIGTLTVAPGPGSLFRTAIIKKIGYFDEHNKTEDMEIALRLLSRGYKVENSLEAVSLTVVPRTLSSFVKQRVRWYYGFFFNMAKYRKNIFSTKDGRLDITVFGLIFSSVALSILVIPTFIYVIWTYAYAFYVTAANTSILYVMANSLNVNYFLFSFDALSVLGLAVLAVGAYMLFYALHGVKKKFDIKRDVLGLLLYIFVYSYILAFTWLYAFIQYLFTGKQGSEWKAKIKN